MAGEQLGIYPIQPNYYRAPEVILGPWMPLGFQGRYLELWCAGKCPCNYLLGVFVIILFDKLWNDTGELCNNAQKFFGDPFFNAEGRLTIISYVDTWHTDCVQDEFHHNELIPSRGLEDTTPFLEGKDREVFLSFARQMLTWFPEKRRTACELMDHSFLKLEG